MENKVRCNNCMCLFEEEELVLLSEVDEQTKYIEYFNGCPNCLTDAYLTDLD